MKLNCKSIPVYVFLIISRENFLRENEWRRLHNEELHSLYRSPNTVRVIKSRRLRWADNVATLEEGEVLSKY